MSEYHVPLLLLASNRLTYLPSNFAKLSCSLRNLCSNMARDFGFHTSIIVGGPLVRDDGRLSVFT